ncbi:hypothetical protein [Dysgonomonas macrotermitis]|nr:hypothetical protein [Dysgonomonas macrotermitis]
MTTRYFILFLLLTSYFHTFAQTQATGLQGLIDSSGNQYYEWAGYDVYLEEIKTPKNSKDISKLKKKYGLKNIKNEYSSLSISYPNTIIYSKDILERNGEKYPEIDEHRILYILDNLDNASSLIYIRKIGKRNTDIEKQILNLYFTQQLHEYIVPMQIDSIDFAGRTLQLGNICEWRSPHNIYCNGGQVSWSVFNTLDQAKDEVDNYIKTSESKYHVTIEDKELPLLFEGKKSIARRIVYKSIYNSEAYPLIVYYITAEIRNRYISCILSHYGYNRDDYELPELLKELIQFEEVPESAWNKYNIPEKDELKPEQKEEAKRLVRERKYKSPFLNIKSGMYIPLGKQQDILGISPYIELDFNLNLSRYYDSNSSILFSLGFVMPNDRKRFNYYTGTVLSTKAHAIGNLNVGYRYTSKLSQNIYWDNYTKIGISAITTNLKKEDKKKNDQGGNTYSVDVFNWIIGTHFRFKQGGIFFEYQFAPYGKSEHLDVGGNSAILTGLSFSF